MELTISEIATQEELEKILPLIAEYQQYYHAEPNEERNRKHFSELFKHRNLGIQFGAFSETGEALGFATLYFRLSSVTARWYCVMNDLFTLPIARKQGVASALVKHCILMSAELGFSTIAWQTEAENSSAQKLYSKIPGAISTDWKKYSAPCLRDINSYRDELPVLQAQK